MQRSEVRSGRKCGSQVDELLIHRVLQCLLGSRVPGIVLSGQLQKALREGGGEREASSETLRVRNQAEGRSAAEILLEMKLCAARIRRLGSRRRQRCTS